MVALRHNCVAVLALAAAAAMVYAPSKQPASEDPTYFDTVQASAVLCRGFAARRLVVSDYLQKNMVWVLDLVEQEQHSSLGNRRAFALSLQAEVLAIVGAAYRKCADVRGVLRSLVVVEGMPSRHGVGSYAVAAFGFPTN